MAWDSDDIAYSHLFIAAPELIWEEEVTDYLIQRGLISGDSIRFLASIRRNKKRYERIKAKTAGKPLIGRLLAVAPEALSLDTINLLSNAKLITKRDAHVLRLAHRAAGAIGAGGRPSDRNDIIRRARRLFGVGVSEESIALLRTIGAIDVEDANKLRAVLLSGGVTIETLAKVRRVKSFADMLALVGSGLIDARAIQAMRLTGVMDGRTAAALLNALSYGKAQWRVWEGAKKAEGLAARMAFVASGSFSFESLALIKSLGYLTPEQEEYLKFAIQVSQRYNRELMEQFTERKYRVVDGEAPIATFARSSQETDASLLRLLAEASENASKEARKLSGIRGAQYAIQARQLHVAMRQVWEGVGYLSIFGEHKVADAAIQSTEMLQGALRAALPETSRRMLEYQARAGLDSYVSRKENTLQLSRRVYGNLNLWTRKVDKVINLAILQGKSAQEIAKDVTGLINPKTPGGVKYAAMRLGRTELANAFHNTTIRHTREMPWIQGYKWSRSRSHGSKDICDQYANEDHDGMGPGVFKKNNVPQKPHPQCMCYITAVEPDEATFKKNLDKGLYNQYLNTMKTDAALPPTVTERLILGGTKKAATIASKVALSKGLSLADKMMENGRANNFGYNPVQVTMPVLKPATRPGGRRMFAETLQVSAHTEPGEVAEALVKGETKAKRALRLRQAQFADLRSRESATNRLTPATLRVKEAFDKKNYDSALPDLQTTIFNDDAAIISHQMYGTRGYRSINQYLRGAKGSLKKYDASFGDEGVFFAGIKGIDTEDWQAEDIFNDALMEATQHLVDPDDDEAHYWDSIQNAFEHFGRGSGTRIRSHSDIIRNMDSKMMPTKVDAFNYRVAGKEFFGLGRDLTPDDVGHVFKEEAFTSTEGIKSYFDNVTTEGIDTRTRPNRIRIYTPKGTMATRINEAEYEILMSRGTKFQVMGVKDLIGEAFSKEIDLMIIGQDKLKSWSEFGYLEDSPEADLMDQILGNF